MKVGYVQTSPIFGDKDTNFKDIEVVLENIKADIIILPELFATGYTFISKEEAYSFAEDNKGKTAQFLLKIAKKTNSTIIGGFIEKEGEEIYNAALIASSKGVLGTYRKIHLYFKEKLWFSRGNTPLKVFESNGTKIGIMICFDWIFPETARTLALLGADIIAHPANLVLPFCQNAMVTRCLENKIFAVTSNRIGAEKRGSDHFKFTGKSQITSFNGEVLSSAPDDKPHIDFVDIDIEQARDKRLNDYNDLLKDRSPDLYFIKDK
jgi:predicted amidohydrolase